MLVSFCKLLKRVRHWFLWDEGGPDSSIDTLFVPLRLPRVLRFGLISFVLGGSALATVALDQRRSGPALLPVTIRVDPPQLELPSSRSVTWLVQTPDQAKTRRGQVEDRVPQLPTDPQWRLHERTPLIPPVRPTDASKKQPLEVTRPDPKTGSEPILSRALAKKDIQAMMQPWKGPVLVCYDKLLATQPQLEGIVQITVEIVPDGSVTAVAARGLDPEVTTCIEKAFRGAKLKLVKPVDQPLSFTYPFRLDRSLPIW